MVKVRLWFLLHILRMNGQDLTKFCILIITDKIYVRIVMHHQFFKNRYAPVYPYPSAMAGLLSDPLKILVSDRIFILAGDKKNYIGSIEFEIGPDQTMDCGVNCPWPIEKIFYLLEYYLKYLLVLRWAIVALWATCLSIRCHKGKTLSNVVSEIKWHGPASLPATLYISFFLFAAQELFYLYFLNAKPWHIVCIVCRRYQFYVLSSCKKRFSLIFKFF